MATIAGVDGCKSGWICISRDTATGLVDSAAYHNAQTLLEQNPEPDMVAVDIPIGLIDSGPRQCDIEARIILKKRHSSVFPAPIRDILQVDTYERANAIQKERYGKGVSKQCYAICKKILEFDTILSQNPQKQNMVKEIHPEVCFWALNNKQPLAHNKKIAEGLEYRRRLIVDHFGIDALSTVRGKHFSKDVADDDIHDAFAALWTAERIFKKEACRIPEYPLRDNNGLFMEIWY